MSYLQAAFFLNKIAYAQTNVDETQPVVVGGTTSDSAPAEPTPYTPPPLPGGHGHPLYRRLALAKETLDNEWRNWVVARGEGNPYGFMGYIAQHSPEARARAARNAIVAPAVLPQKVGSFAQQQAYQTLRRQKEDGKFRPSKPGDEKPSSEEISMAAKKEASAFYGLKEAGFFDAMSHAIHGTPHVPVHVPLANVRPHAPLMEYSGKAFNNASTKVLNAPGRAAPAHLGISEETHPWAQAVLDAVKQPGSIVDNSYSKLRAMNVPIEYPHSMNHLFEQLEGLGVPGHHLTALVKSSQYRGKLASAVLGTLAGTAIGGGLGYAADPNHTLQSTLLGAAGGGLAGGMFGSALGKGGVATTKSVATPKVTSAVIQPSSPMPKSEAALEKLRGVMQEGDKAFSNAGEAGRKLDTAITQHKPVEATGPKTFLSKDELMEHFGYGADNTVAAAHRPHENALAHVWNHPAVPKTVTDVEQAAYYLREMRHPANGPGVIAELKAARSPNDPAWMDAIIQHAESLGPYTRPRIMT